MDGIFILMGIALIVLGPYTYVYNKKRKGRLRNKGMKAQAVVIEIKREYKRGLDDNDGGWQYFPVVEYMADGNVHRKLFGMGEAECSYQVGDVLNIIYDTDNPEDIELESAVMNHSGLHEVLIMVMLIIAGLFFAGVGGFTRLFTG